MAIAKKLDVSEVQKDKIAHLECELSSESKQVIWQKDHQEIEMEAKYQVATEDKSEIMLIKDVQQADLGVCTLPGEAKTSVKLDHEGICPGSNIIHRPLSSLSFLSFKSIFSA